MKEIRFSSTQRYLFVHKKILIDANIILNQLYDDSLIGQCCCEALNFLSKYSSLYISNVVISEIINKVIYTEFISEMYYKIDNAQPINSPNEIDKIVKYLNSLNDINFSLLDEKSLNNTDLKMCFNRLSKNKSKRYLLKPYFDKTIQIYNELQDKYNFHYLYVDEKTYNDSLDSFQMQLIGINDAQHLQVAINNNIDYILTCDKDFSFIAQSYKTYIMKIDSNSIDVNKEISVDEENNKNK